MQVFSTRLSIAFVVLTAAAAPTFASNYTEADSRPIARVDALSRAEVAADTSKWVRSGLAMIEHRQVGTVVR